MIWIDSALLWYASYRVCRNGCGWALYWEKLALALIFALALKGLFLFFLISSGIRPTAIIQMGLSFLALTQTLFLTKNKFFGGGIAKHRRFFADSSRKTQKIIDFLRTARGNTFL